MLYPILQRFQYLVKTQNAYCRAIFSKCFQLWAAISFRISSLM